MILPFFSYTTHIHRPPPHQPQRWERGLDLWLNCFSTTLLIILRRRQRIPQSFWTMRRSRGWILVLWSNSLEYHLPNPRTLLLPKSNLIYVSFSFSFSDIFLKKGLGIYDFDYPSLSNSTPDTISQRHLDPHAHSKPCVYQPSHLKFPKKR